MIRVLFLIERRLIIITDIHYKSNVNKIYMRGTECFEKAEPDPLNLLVNTSEANHTICI